MSSDTSRDQPSSETDKSDASFHSVVDDLLTGQLSNPVRVVAFKTYSLKATTEERIDKARDLWTAAQRG